MAETMLWAHGYDWARARGGMPAWACALVARGYTEWDGAWDAIRGV